MDGIACIYGGESSSIQQRLQYPSTCLHTSQNNQPANKKPNAYPLEKNKENIKVSAHYRFSLYKPAPPDISLYVCVCAS